MNKRNESSSDSDSSSSSSSSSSGSNKAPPNRQKQSSAKSRPDSSNISQASSTKRDSFMTKGRAPERNYRSNQKEENREKYPGDSENAKQKYRSPVIGRNRMSPEGGHNDTSPDRRRDYGQRNDPRQRYDTHNRNREFNRGGRFNTRFFHNRGGYYDRYNRGGNRNFRRGRPWQPRHYNDRNNDRDFRGYRGYDNRNSDFDNRKPDYRRRSHDRDIGASEDIREWGEPRHDVEFDRVSNNGDAQRPRTASRGSEHGGTPPLLRELREEIMNPQHWGNAERDSYHSRSPGRDLPSGYKDHRNVNRRPEERREITLAKNKQESPRGSIVVRDRRFSSHSDDNQMSFSNRASGRNNVRSNLPSLMHVNLDTRERKRSPSSSDSNSRKRSPTKVKEKLKINTTSKKFSSNKKGIRVKSRSNSSVSSSDDEKTKSSKKASAALPKTAMSSKSSKAVEKEKGYSSEDHQERLKISNKSPKPVKSASYTKDHSLPSRDGGKGKEKAKNQSAKLSEAKKMPFSSSSESVSSDSGSESANESKVPAKEIDEKATATGLLESDEQLFKISKSPKVEAVKAAPVMQPLSSKFIPLKPAISPVKAPDSPKDHSDLEKEFNNAAEKFESSNDSSSEDENKKPITVRSTVQMYNPQSMKQAGYGHQYPGYKGQQEDSFAEELRNYKRDRQKVRQRSPADDQHRAVESHPSKTDISNSTDMPKKSNETVTKSTELLTTKTGGAYIPPAKLRQMQAHITDKSSIEYQRIAWETLKKSMNGLINKVNTSNLFEVVRELIKENIVRGQGALCRSIMQAQAASPTFTHVYAAVVAIINTKFPQTGELLLKRLVIQFRRAFRRNDKDMCLSCVRFLAHLVNQQVAHEVLALQMLTVLLETPSDDSVEVAVEFLKNVGAKLMEVSTRGIQAVMDSLKHINSEGTVSQRVQYMIEVMFAIRKDGFKDFPSIIEELDLIEEKDQFTHLLTLDEEISGEDQLNVFKFDPNYVENEEKYADICKVMLEEDTSDESGSESDGGEKHSEDQSQDEEEKQTIIDSTETNLTALRRVIYLTIQSSLDFEECTHKLVKLDLLPGQEVELCNMVLDSCAQLRTYEKFYGLVAQRLCQIDKKYVEPTQDMFKEQFETCHRLETDKLRNVARFFGHLLYTDAISWGVLSICKLNEEDTTSASRIFLKILFQELSASMGVPKLNERLQDPSLQEFFEGLLPHDNPKNTRFAINFFTTIGLGGLTDELRDHLTATTEKLHAEKEALAKEPVVAPTPTAKVSSSDSDSDSSDSDSDNSSSDSSSSEEESKKKKQKKNEKTKQKKDKPKKKSKKGKENVDTTSESSPEKSKDKDKGSKRRSEPRKSADGSEVKKRRFVEEKPMDHRNERRYYDDRGGSNWSQRYPHPRDHGNMRNYNDRMPYPPRHYNQRGHWGGGPNHHWQDRNMPQRRRPIIHETEARGYGMRRGRRLPPRR